MIASARATPLKAATPARLTRPRRPLVSAAAFSSKTQQQQQKQHLTAVALPHARRRFAPFARADATLAALVADPLLIEATATTTSGGSSKRTSSATEATRVAAAAIDAAVGEALARAFSDDDDATATSARLFLQRALYRVNRLSYFFYDGVPLDATYANERAPCLLALRERVEAAWQPWELAQMAAKGGEGDNDRAAAAALLARYRSLDARAVENALLSRLERDRYQPSATSTTATSSSPDLAALRDRLNPRGYAHLLAAGAHDGLTEASRQSRVCAGAGHAAGSACFRILSDEYGGGRLEGKHSTFYGAAMRACGVMPTEGDDDDHETPPPLPPGLSPVAERWLDLVPWESLASTNHSFFLAERRRHFLRYCGALAAFELAGPRAYEAYAAAADRLGGGDDGNGSGAGDALGGYWRLHVREDAKHGPQALQEVALPLVRLYGDAHGWEVMLGYDQENFLAARATAAVRRDVEACGGLD